MQIRLTQGEVLFAALIGVLRRTDNIEKRRRTLYGTPYDGWNPDIEGACGELAVAKHFDCFWAGALGDLSADDVGRLQVRTAARDDSRLILHERDADDRAFLLVTGQAPHYRLVGWILARDGKRSEWWVDPAGGRPAFFVPQSALRPIDELALKLEFAE